MRNALLVTGLGVCVTIGLFGCGGGDSPEPNGSGKQEKVTPFAPDQGQTPLARLAYPEGATGVGKGSIIQNFVFVGYANKQDNTGLQYIQMADFYNPTGDGKFTEENPSFKLGAEKPKALLIDVASVWCVPCNMEAHYALPDLHNKYAPGGEFLLTLADSNTPGEPATTKNLNQWTTKYLVDYPATIDPSYKLGMLFDQDAFPTNMIIDTRTMKIVEVIAGTPGGFDNSTPPKFVPDPGFWNTFQKVIDGTAN
jgi:hypothetical protein